MYKIVCLIIVVALAYCIWPFAIAPLIIFAIFALFLNYFSVFNNKSIKHSQNANVCSAQTKEKSTQTYEKQIERYLSLIIYLSSLDDLATSKLVKRLNYYYHSFVKKQHKTNDFSLYLYDYILISARKLYSASRKITVQKDCKSTIRIVFLLKQEKTNEEIAYAINHTKVNNTTRTKYAIQDSKSTIRSNTTIKGKSDKKQRGNNSIISQTVNSLCTSKKISSLISSPKTNTKQTSIEFAKEDSIEHKSKNFYLSQIVQAIKDFAILREEKQAYYLSDDSDISILQILNGLKVYALQKETHEGSVKCHILEEDNDTLKPKHLEPSVLLSVSHWERTYIYSVDNLDNANFQQKQYYYYFKKQILKGIYPDIKENSNYAFVLLFDLAEDYKSHKDLNLLKQQLKVLGDNYPILAKHIDRIISKAAYDEKQEKAQNKLKYYQEDRGQLCRWVKPNEPIYIQGITITKGNFYLGECFLLPKEARYNGYFYEKSNPYIYGPVLDDKLPISHIDSGDKAFSSYHTMSPFLRYQYLMWLSNQRKICELQTEILLIHLYGYDLRMFVDKQTSMSERESILRDSISLLKSLNYNENTLLYLRLSDFIGCSIMKFFRDRINDFHTKGLLQHSYIFKNILISHRIAEKKSLSPEDAFEIADELYDLQRLAPSGFFQHITKLFTDQFSKLYTDDDLITFISTTSNQSSTFFNDLEYFTSEKFNFSHSIGYSQPSNLWLISNIIDQCRWHLESLFRPYSRIKKKYNGRETIAATFLLPTEIDVQFLPKVKRLKTLIDGEMRSNEFIKKPIDWVLNLWEYERNEDKSIHKEFVDSILLGLHKLGYGIVPNYKIDNKRYNFGDTCIIYKNNKRLNFETERNIDYEMSEVFIKLASHIVLADGISKNDLPIVEQQIKIYNNTEENLLHLRAYARWKFATKKTPIDKRAHIIISNIGLEQRTVMGNALIRLACVNNDIHPNRIESLKKILALLDFNFDNIHSLVHQFIVDKDGFSVIEKKFDAIEYSIVDPKSIKGCFTFNTNVEIDHAKLERLEENTKIAQKILSDIFIEDDADNQESNSPTNPNKDYLEILKLLLTKDVWSRIEIENICKENGLMMGATLEQINDFAYEKVGDIVIEEDGDLIFVELNYKEQLL